MHYSVMLNEVIKSLNLKDTGTYVDCTLGYAGHTSEILKRVKRGVIFAFDQDINAINYSKEKLSKFGDNKLLIMEFSKNILSISLTLTVSFILLIYSIISTFLNFEKYLSNK